MSYARVWARRGAALLVIVLVGVLTVPALASSAPTAPTATTPFVPGGEAQFSGDPALPSSCQDSFTADLALLCDQSAALRDPQLHITGLRYPQQGQSFASIMDQPQTSMEFSPANITGSYVGSQGEPLLPGETVTATWGQISPAPLLAVRVADPLRGSRAVVFDLPAAAHSATLTVDAAGAVTLRSDGSAQTQASPPPAVGDPGVTVPWVAATPAAAVTQFISHLALNSGSDPAWLCAAIEPDLRAELIDQSALGPVLQPIPTSAWPLELDPSQPCELLDLALFGDENVPVVTGSTGTVTGTTYLTPRTAVVTATLIHHYAASDSDPGPTGEQITTTATTLATLDSDGQWHVADFETLLPLHADGGNVDESAAQLLAQRKVALRQSLAGTRAEQRYLAAQHRASVPVGNRPVCSGSRSVTAQDIRDEAGVSDNPDGSAAPSENPRYISIDARSATLAVSRSRLCLSVTFRRGAPSAADFDLELLRGNNAADINVAVGPREAAADPLIFSAAGGRYRSLPHMRVARAGHTLVLSLPVADIRDIDPAKSFSWYVQLEGPSPYVAQVTDSVPNDFNPITLPAAR